jgi:hypothetical protein
MNGTQALRLRGRGDRVRLRRIGSWNRAPLDDLAVTCRTSTAVDKAFAETISAARQAGHTWPKIASALGLQPTLTSWEEISAALAASRQQAWGRGLPSD